MKATIDTKTNLVTLHPEIEPKALAKFLAYCEKAKVDPSKELSRLIESGVKSET